MDPQSVTEIINALKEAGAQIGQPALEHVANAVYLSALAEIIGGLTMIALALVLFSLEVFKLYPWMKREDANGIADGWSFGVNLFASFGGGAIFFIGIIVLLSGDKLPRLFDPIGYLVLHALVR